MTILSIDPGNNVGFAVFTDKGREINRGVTSFDGIEEWLDHMVHPETSQLVVEGFRHNPTVKQGGSLHWASQVEGMVKLIGYLRGVPVEVQYPGDALPVAKLFTGYVDPVTKTGNKKHLPDEDSAWLHGMYWLRKNDLV